MDENRPRTVSDAFPSRFLSNSDLRGTAYTLEIVSLTFETMRDRFTNQEIAKPVVRFRGAKKPMALNKTQCYRLAEICGSDVFERWVGHTIQIRPGTIKGKPTILIDPAPSKDIP